MKKLKQKLIHGALIIGALSGLTACASSKDAEIKVYTRDTASGTRDGFFTGIGFKDAIKDNSILTSRYIEVASNGDMINSIKNDEYGIGYISLSSLSDSGLRGLVYEGVVPSEDNVLNDTYKLTRNFNYCKRGEYNNNSASEIVDAFIAYMYTIEGKATIKEHGGILETTKEDKPWDVVKENFVIDDKDNSEITITVGGSTSVKSIVSNLLTEFSAKCGNFKFNYSPTGSGDAYKRTNGSEKDGVNSCDLAFASREFSDSEQMDEALKGKMCTDAIVAVVNKKNSIDSINANTLKSIYKGEIKTWNEMK